MKKVAIKATVYISGLLLLNSGLAYAGGAVGQKAKLPKLKIAAGPGGGGVGFVPTKPKTFVFHGQGGGGNGHISK